jgi:hypothetical protein
MLTGATATGGQGSSVRCGVCSLWAGLLALCSGAERQGPSAGKRDVGQTNEGLEHSVCQDWWYVEEAKGYGEEPWRESPGT